MHIVFSQDLQVVTDISLINENVLDIRIIPDESSLVENLDQLEFDWRVTEFKMDFMDI